jgi:hypothetical protein
LNCEKALLSGINRIEPSLSLALLELCWGSNRKYVHLNIDWGTVFLLQFMGLSFWFQVLLALDDALSGDFGSDFFVFGFFELEVIEGGGCVFPCDGEGLILAC